MYELECIQSPLLGTTHKADTRRTTYAVTSVGRPKFNFVISELISNQLPIAYCSNINSRWPRLSEGSRPDHFDSLSGRANWMTETYARGAGFGLRSRSCRQPGFSCSATLALKWSPRQSIEAYPKRNAFRPEVNVRRASPNDGSWTDAQTQISGVLGGRSSRRRPYIS
jgi:hypothetical protein